MSTSRRARSAPRGAPTSSRIRYAHQRETFGQPLAPAPGDPVQAGRHGDASIEAARLLTVQAARAKDAGPPADVETGMAKLSRPRCARRSSIEAMRIHGGYGYSKEYEIERLYRDAPMLLIGEGTSEIQRTIIARGLTRRWKDERDGT